MKKKVLILLCICLTAILIMPITNKVEAKSKKAKTTSIDFGIYLDYEQDLYYKYGTIKSGDVLYMYSGQHLDFIGNISNYTYTNQENGIIYIENVNYLDYTGSATDSEMENPLELLDKLDTITTNIYSISAGEKGTSKVLLKLDNGKEVSFTVKVVDYRLAEYIRDLVSLDLDDTFLRLDDTTSLRLDTDSTFSGILSTKILNNTLSKIYFKVLSTKNNTKFMKVSANSSKTLQCNYSEIGELFDYDNSEKAIIDEDVVLDNDKVNPELFFVIKYKNLYIESDTYTIKSNMHNDYGEYDDD